MTIAPKENPIEHRFSPYSDNGGTTVAVAGEDFCIVAGDTRSSEGYQIHSRYAPKVYHLTNDCVLATSGFHADGRALVKAIEQRLEIYTFQHEKKMTPGSMAQMLATMLYHKRFFPYYTFNILGGLDEQGRGAVFSYDPVGNFERESWRSAGSASHLIQPFLDNQIGKKHQNNIPHSKLSLDETLKIVKDAFSSATERDIYTGDFVEIFIIKKEGVTVQLHELKMD